MNCSYHKTSGVYVHIDVVKDLLRKLEKLDDETINERVREIRDVACLDGKLVDIVRCHECRLYNEDDSSCEYHRISESDLYIIGNGFCHLGEQELSFREIK
jgi:hypothetical protein